MGFLWFWYTADRKTAKQRHEIISKKGYNVIRQFNSQLLVAGLEHVLFSHILGRIIIPSDELIFFREVGWNHQPYIYIILYYIILYYIIFILNNIILYYVILYYIILCYFYIWYHIPSRISLIYHWYIHENHVILRGSLSVWSLRSPWRRQHKRWRRPGVVWKPQVIKRGYGKSTKSPINGKIIGKSREIPELNGQFVRWENLRVILGHGDFLSHDDWRVNSSVLWSTPTTNRKGFFCRMCLYGQQLDEINT